ncbi:unnamed protein product [Adineta ricciae]|uniref:Caspase family p20 domain-containing protein n=1 Tax=Adineta ricciae TaxID=249248 RepID=A0A815EP44_ADIRI|nr:unnamed protein product [Adineta ricciae]
MYPKHALVIGNEAYMRSPILSCVNDATDMTTTLNAMGFQVQPATNIPYEGMQAITGRFIQSIQPGSIVIFYFSGHGIQYNGVNYLLGIDDERLLLKTLDDQALNVQKVIDAIHTRQPRLVLCILDACRGYEVNDTSDASRLYTSLYRGRPDRLGLGVGLAPMQAPPATIIVFACEEDKFSSSLSQNQRNSLYTFHLLRHICTPNTDIDIVLKNTAADVQRDPMNFLQQIPFRYSSLNESICLLGSNGMNYPMGMQGGYGYQSYQQPLMMKAHHVEYYNPYTETYYNLSIVPFLLHRNRKRPVVHKTPPPVVYGYPRQWQSYYQ